MGSATVVPNAPAAAPAPAASSAPASSPSTSVGSGAASTTTTSQPVVGTPSTSPAEPLGGKSAEQHLADLIAERTKPSTVKVEDAPVVESDADDTNANDIAVDDDADADVDEEAADSEEVVQPDADEDDDFADFTLEDVGGIAPKELAEKLEARPDILAALEEMGIKDQIFASSRLAAEAALFKAEFPGGVEQAKMAAESHATYTNIADLFSNVLPYEQKGGPESTMQVFQALLDTTVLRDDDGNPVMGANGQPRTSGVVGKFLSNMTERRLQFLAPQIGQKNELTQAFGVHLGALREAAMKAGNEETVAAVDQLLTERPEFRAASDAPQGPDGNDELATQRAELERREQALNQRETERRAQEAQAYESRIESTIDSKVDTAIESILSAATGLNEFTRRALDNNLRSELVKAIKADPFYRKERHALNNKPQSPKTEKERVAIAVKALKTHLKPIAQRLMAEAGASQADQQAALDQKRTARQQNSRSDTGAAMRTARTSAPGQLTGAAATDAARTELRTSLGREPEMDEIIRHLATARMTKR